MTDLRLGVEAAERIRSEVQRAGGREVCFLATVGEGRVVMDPRAVSRGNREAVLVAAREAEPGSVMIHNHPSGLLEPSNADMAVAGRLYEAGLGTAITDNQASRLYVVVEPPAPRIVSPIDADALDTVLAPGGALSTIHPAYEDRGGQRAMLRLVAEAFNEGGVTVVEAGTGTGKSLAYLLPSAAWAARNGERTVVSTNTINLQEQLVAQDLPLVRRLVDEEVDWALIKGRGNYVSIRRARLALEQGASLFPDDRVEELEAIVSWTGSSDDGSLSDLPFVPSSETWEEVRSDSDICLRARCPHFQECFYQRARRGAASADLLVVNHHLLFTDLAVRRATHNYSDAAVLPPYRHLILDEAHNVEDAATSHLGVEVSRAGLARTLSRLSRKGKGVLAAIDDRLRGASDRAAGRATGAGTGPAAGAVTGTGPELRSRIETRVRPALERTRSRVEIFFDALETLLPEGAGEAERIGTGDLPEPAERIEVRERLDALLGSLADLAREIGELRRRLELDDEWAEALEGRLLDLKSLERRVGDAAAALRLVLLPDEESRHGFVRWIEHRRGGRGRDPYAALAAAPIRLGPLLRDGLFERVDTAVLSSATLTTRKGFDFFRRRLGLETEGSEEADEAGFTVKEAVVPSPFDFRTQTVFAVPTDLPDLRASGSAHEDATARVVAELAEITDGGVFALFTSHRSLQESARRLRGRGIGRDFPLFVHGEESRARLLEGFVASGRGLLLGTASFWEGVDVPGHPLRALVIQKLPFKVPTEPVTAARLEAVEADGGDPFRHYMLPLAALRLKQGFGRLIRSGTDRGAVVLLDDRILRRRYGRYLRDSLPDAPLVKGPWREVTRSLSSFYGSGASIDPFPCGSGAKP